MVRFIRSLVPFLCASAFLAGCSSGGGGGGSISFSGTILGPAGAGLQGAIVQVSSATRSAQATTDGSGNFIVLKPPTGLVDLHIDGSNVPGGTFADLEIALVVGGGASNLSQPIVLPDLGAGTTVSVPVDANGMTMGVMTVTAPDGSALTIPDMTTILVDGAIPPGTVDVNVTPVDAINVPMPLPGMQDPGAFVTIQPPGAAFTPALDITLPNTRGFPLGTMVDIWSFDHDLGMWVNRSEETGNQGTVVDIGGMEFIVAMGVITEGGWHAGTLPVDLTCATTLAGQVFTLGAPTPLADVLISLSTGQFTRTGADGRFSIPAVPAYDASMLPKTCVPSDLELRAIAPVAFGANQVSMTITAGTIMTGGTTTLAPFDIPVTNTGSLVGSVTDDGQGVAGTVSITGTAKLSTESDEDGSFFVAAMDPGPYTATFPFSSGDESENFTIEANETTVVNLRAGPPPTGGALNVLVLDFSVTFAGTPVDDACVTLQGASGAPLFATTGANGIAAFASTPSGPYAVTAQKDFTIPFGTLRLGSTVLGANPVGSPRTIAIPFFDDGGFQNPLAGDANLDGTLLNTPAGADFAFQVVTETGGGFQSGNTITGNAFSLQIPSGVPLEVAVRATDQVSGEILSAVFATNLMVASGGTLMQDFDFANACPFDRPVTVSYTNTQAHSDFFADLELSGAGNLDFPFSDGNSLPTSFNWPDLASAKLTGFDAFFEVASVESATTFEESFCDLALGNTTPTSLTVNFIGIPTIQNPANNAVFPSYGTGSMVQYTLGSGNGQTAGFNNVTLVGEGKASQIFTFWDIFAPPTANKVTLPAVFASKPMFSDGFYAVNVEATRFPFSGFDYSTFFDEDLPSKVAAVIASELCTGDRSHFFLVGTQLTAGPSPADRARLHARARAGGLR